MDLKPLLYVKPLSYNKGTNETLSILHKNSRQASSELA